MYNPLTARGFPIDSVKSCDCGILYLAKVLECAHGNERVKGIYRFFCKYYHIPIALYSI